MYCDIDDLKSKYPEEDLIRLSSETDTLNADIVNECINEADAEINAYLKKFYKTPLEPVPDVIRKISAILTFANLHERRGFYSEAENIRKPADNLLKQINKRQVVLGDEDTETNKPASKVIFSSNPRLFGRL